MLIAHHGISRRSLCGQPLIEPRENWGNFGILITQSMNKLNRKSVGKRHALQIGENRRAQAPERASPSQQSVSEMIRLLPCDVTVHNPAGQPPQIFDEHNPERNRKPPRVRQSSAAEFPDMRVHIDTASRRRSDCQHARQMPMRRRTHADIQQMDHRQA